MRTLWPKRKIPTGTLPFSFEEECKGSTKHFHLLCRQTDRYFLIFNWSGSCRRWWVVVQWLAGWAHDHRVVGSKPSSITVLFLRKEFFERMKRSSHLSGQVKDGVYYCYCPYVLRISRNSNFLWVVLINTGILLRGSKLCGESRT